MKQPYINYDAIVIWRRKTAYYSLITFVTAQRGLITCMLHNERLQRLKHSSYLRPFSAVHMSVVPQGEFYQLQQIDGVYVNKSMDEDLGAIGYGALVGELITQLFPAGEVDPRLFLKVHQFSLAIQEKNVPLAAILFGWQLLNMAGFVVTESNPSDWASFWEELSAVTSVPEEVRSAIPMVLEYDWEVQPSLRFSKECWQGLANSLMQYAQHCLGKPLTTLGFIQEMNLSPW